MTTQVRFGLSVSGLLKNSDDDFLGSILWRSSETTTCGNADSDFSLRTIGMCWKQQCLDRPVPKLISGVARFSTLDDAVAAADVNSVLAVLARVRSETSPTRRPPKESLKKQAKEAARLSRETTELLRLWLSNRASEAEECSLALLACCELLSLYGSQFPAEVIGGLWRVTLAGALAQSESFVKAAGIEDWDEYVSAEGADGATWLKAGLLPFICGLLFDDVKGAPRLFRTGRTSLNDQLLQVTDEGGVPTGDVYAAMPRFLSLWIDGLLVARLFEGTLWKKPAAKRFEKMLPRLAAAVRDGGVLTCATNGESAADILRIAAELQGTLPEADWVKSLELAGNADLERPQSPATKKTIPTKAKSGKSKKKVAKAAIPSWQSDDTDAACLRTSWAPDASLATVRFDGEPVQLELVVDGVPVFSGAWNLELAEGGQILELEDEWECICWSSDSDGDFLELQLEFEGGPMINRYIFLSRTQQFAIISDIVSGSNAERIDLGSLLPLADGVTLKTDGTCREQILTAGENQVRVFPLALPQDPGVGTAGSVGLAHQDDTPCLAISQASESGTMFSPIVLDWSPERRSLPAEWRQLTVTRASEIDSTGAASMRIQVGKLHLVLYRSLCESDRYRTFLGYQSESETVIGKFTKSGVIQEILIVE